VGNPGSHENSAAGFEVQGFAVYCLECGTVRITLAARAFCTAPNTWIVKQNRFFENREKHQKLCKLHKKDGEKLPKRRLSTFNSSETA